MPLNLRQIEVFRAVMITGSITGASELLFVSQPAVSRLLSHTESRVGFPLFARIKGRLYPTPEAKKLLLEVESVYAGVNRVNELAQELRENSDGILNIVSSPSMGQMIIPQAVTRFRRHYPNVKVTFQYLAPTPLMERVLNRQADLAVTLRPVEHPNLIAMSLGSAGLVCVCPYDHPLTRLATLSVPDLQPWPLVSYERSSYFGRMVNQLFESAGHTVRAAIEVGSPQNAYAMVQAGAGIALVDEFSVRSWTNHRLVVRPVHGTPLVHASLAHLRFDPLPQIAHSFISELRTLMHGDASLTPYGGAGMHQHEVA
jgi:DNA-binding transcriptional LysR family regulator